MEGHLVGTESVLVHTPCKMPLCTVPPISYDRLMSDKKRWAELRKQLQQAGCTLTLTPRNHYKVHRDGRLLTVLAGTASDPRALRNTIALLRREGITL